MTKKQNRRFAKRRVRRALNAALDFFKGISGRRLNQHLYGGGITKRDVRQRFKGN